MDAENLISILSESLKYYGEQANYDNNQINLDRGHNARFVLDLVQKNKETLFNYEKEFEENEKLAEDTIEKLKLINDLINKENGGNLFKAGRISKDEYFDICYSLQPVLDKHFEFGYRIPKAYRNKINYGDVDIILDAKVVLNKKNWKKELCNDLGVTETKNVKNVFSMLYRNFQVDIFLVGTAKLDTCFNFMSYNVLGNLIGRIYHKFNLRYGEDGLHYVLRGYNNYISKEILVSRDMKQILEFVDLSYARWLYGFENLEDIFKYVISSKYFCSDSYDLKYYTIEKRAKERPDFNAFLEYLNTNNIVKNYPFLSTKEIYLPDIDEYFGTELNKNYIKHCENQKLLEEVSKKFNGKIVIELIPELNGKELGRFIDSYKKSLEPFIDCILEMTEKEIKEDILYHYKYYGKEI